MFFLSGLLGMMALGSVAIVSTGAFDDDPLTEGPSPDHGGGPDPGDEDSTDWHAAQREFGQTPDLPTQTRGADDPGGSLFARMGLINMPFDDGAPRVAVLPELAAEAPASDAPHLPVGPEPVEATREQTEVIDFDEAEDQLVIIYDDSAGGGDPTMEMRASAEDPGVTEIVVDGTVLGRLPTSEAPPLSAIFLVGESTAAALNLA